MQAGFGWLRVFVCGALILNLAWLFSAWVSIQFFELVSDKVEALRDILSAFDDRLHAAPRYLGSDSSSDLPDRDALIPKFHNVGFERGRNFARAPKGSTRVL